MDIFDKCERYTLPREVQAAGVYAYYRSISSPQDPVVQMDGEDVIMLGSNNYLGLTNHPRVKEAAKAARSCPCATTAMRVVAARPAMSPAKAMAVPARIV